MPGTTTAEGIDQSFVKALAHPLRVQILIVLNERVASPSDLAEELGAGVSKVAYHVKVLEGAKCVELVRTAQRRGATEHYYRATRRQFFSDSEWKLVPSSAQAGISGRVLQMVFGDVAEAMAEGTFDERDDRHLSRTPMVVDDQGWKDATSLLAETLDGLLRIQAEAADRLAKAGEEGTRTKAEIMHFVSPAPSAKRRRADA